MRKPSGGADACPRSRADKEGRPLSKEKEKKKKKKKKGREVHCLQGWCGGGRTGLRVLGWLWSPGTPSPTDTAPCPQEEEKAVKKKSKHKKSKEEEEGREHGRRRPRSQRSSVDALEAFLGGGAPSGHLRGGGDYEEL